MKDTQISILFMLGMVGLLFLLILYRAGEMTGTSGERDRLYTKCLAEHETMPHKDAVALCKERVK